jgi:hypothetical protein
MVDWTSYALVARYQLEKLLLWYTTILVGIGPFDHVLQVLFGEVQAELPDCPSEGL